MLSSDIAEKPRDAPYYSKMFLRTKKPLFIWHLGRVVWIKCVTWSNDWLIITFITFSIVFNVFCCKNSVKISSEKQFQKIV